MPEAQVPAQALRMIKAKSVSICQTHLTWTQRLKAFEAKLGGSNRFVLLPQQLLHSIYSVNGMTMVWINRWHEPLVKKMSYKLKQLTAW